MAVNCIEDVFLIWEKFIKFCLGERWKGLLWHDGKAQALIDHRLGLRVNDTKSTHSPKRESAESLGSLREWPSTNHRAAQCLSPGWSSRPARRPLVTPIHRLAVDQHA